MSVVFDPIGGSVKFEVTFTGSLSFVTEVFDKAGEIGGLEAQLDASLGRRANVTISKTGRDLGEAINQLAQLHRFINGG